MRLLKTGELLYLCFLIPKYEREVAGGKFSASPCVRKELTVAGPVDCYVFLKKFLMLCSDFFHNVDTFYAYNETIVNIIITSV